MADDATQRAPRRVEIYDTTLRDGSQLEGISLTVDDKLRIAEQLDWLGVDYIEAGWPGSNPKDDELFRRAQTELALDHQHARRVRLDPARRRARSTPTTRCAISSRRGLDGLHRRQVLGLPRDRGARDDARRRRRDGRRLGRVPARPGPRGALRRRALLRRLQARTPSSRSGSSRRQPSRARSRLVLCDTNGGTLPRRGRADGPRGRRLLLAVGRRRVGVAVHLHDDAGTGVANALAGVRGGAMQVQGTINGYGERTGQLQPHHDHPEPHAEDGDRDDPRGPARAADAGRAPRRRAREHGAQPAGRVRRATRRSRTRRACT